jgi:hypothetical protein
MRIGSTSGPSRAERRSKVGGKTAESGFADLLGTNDVAPGSSIAAPPTITAMSSLIAVQEVEDREARRRNLISHGDRLLDLLTDLRNGLVMGGLSRATIETISESLQQRKEAIDDPALLGLIQEIEVRAAVELAKLERLASQGSARK